MNFEHFATVIKTASCVANLKKDYELHKTDQSQFKVYHNSVCINYILNLGAAALGWS